MKTFKLQAVLLIIFPCFIGLNAYAQLSGQVGEFSNLPQSVYANPALQPAGKLNFGIPALSGFYAEHSNNWFRPMRDLSGDSGGNTTIDGATILNNIDKEAVTMAASSIELLHAGVKFGKHYVHFRAAERARMGVAIPRDVFVLGVYGNVGHSEFSDNTANFDGLRVNGIHYREYVLGYSIDLGKWQAGIAAKYLYGMECIKTEESSLELRTDPTTYTMSTNGSFRVNTSGVYGSFTPGATSIHQNMGNYIAGLNNNGFGADIGTVYKPTEKLSINLAFNDLGFITWREDVANYGTDDASFAFNGVDLTEFIFTTGSGFNDALDEEVEQLLSELEDVYGFERTEESFTTTLDGYARLGASYQVVDGKLGRGKLWSNAMYGLNQYGLPLRISGGYNQSFWNIFEASMHITTQQGAGTFFGGGIVMRGGPLQLWCMVENMRMASLTRVTITDSDQQKKASILYPENSGDLRFHFGLNLIFGDKEKEAKSKPMHR